MAPGEDDCPNVRQPHREITARDCRGSRAGARSRSVSEDARRPGPPIAGAALLGPDQVQAGPAAQARLRAAYPAVALR